MLWRPRWPVGVVLVATGLSSAGACAAVFGLDEPTVREGTGGGAAASSGTQDPLATTAVTSGDPSSGGGDPSTGGAGPTGSTGSGGTICDGAAECDDGNDCTADGCVDSRCEWNAVTDGPLVENPTDCRTITCVDGTRVDVANDAEEPGDANPPCALTTCEDGAPVTTNADAGTSCGLDPLECDGDGTCIGCDPQREGQCGATTECAAPTCLDTEVCDPGYVDLGTPASDDVDGDCMGRECTGDSVAAVAVADDTDEPADLPCGTRSCNAGSPTTVTVAEGMPCFGEDGVCDGQGTAPANCKVCRDTVSQGTDPGCTAAAPYCFEDGDGICGECRNENDCQAHPNGEHCDNASHTCGCENGGDCDDSGAGEYCDFFDNKCGCIVGNNCMGPDSWGNVCRSGTCGCNTDDDCDGADTCNTTTHICED